MGSTKRNSSHNRFMIAIEEFLAMTDGSTSKDVVTASKNHREPPISDRTRLEDFLFLKEFLTGVVALTNLFTIITLRIFDIEKRGIKVKIDSAKKLLDRILGVKISSLLFCANCSSFPLSISLTLSSPPYLLSRRLRPPYPPPSYHSVNKGINEKILSFDYTEYKAEIETSDAQNSYKDGVTVLVTGCLTSKDKLTRKFAQSFFLAPQENGFCVLNDVFRYVEDGKLLKNHSINGVNDTTTVHLNQEPEPTHVPDPPAPDLGKQLKLKRIRLFLRKLLTLQTRTDNQDPGLVLLNFRRPGMDNAKNISESSQVLKKRTRRRHRRKPNLMQNTGLVHNLPQEYGQGDTKYMNSLSTLSLSDERGGDVVVISSAAVKTSSEEDIISGISDGSIVKKPFRYTGKKLLILDINGLIPDIVSPPPKGFASDIRIAGRAIFKRPYYLDFLKFCFERFEVGVWSSKSKILSHCTKTGFRTLENKHKTLVFKDLKRIWEEDDSSLPWEKGIYNETNTLLLDDSPYKALLNPAHTGVFPYPYTFHGGCDNALGHGGRLQTYLENLAAAEDLQDFVDQHPFGQRPISERSASWDFYLRVLDTVYSVETDQITWNSTCEH